ncbi:MAG TPA: SMC-Scp complex subunit ScpB [Planctomycetota bacterium]|nr:SMC-Scp complex subunit ScpB [Planctomycetota bacterium]
MSRKSRRSAPVGPDAAAPAAAPAEPAGGPEKPEQAAVAEEGNLDLAAIAARLAARQAEQPPAAPAEAQVESGQSDRSDPSDGSDLVQGPEASAEQVATDGEPAVEPVEEGPEAVLAEPQLSGAELFAAVEALLFAADRPLTPAQIARALPSGIGAKGVRAQLAAITEALADSERGFELREIAGGWQLLTREKYAPFVQRLKRAVSIKKLSGSALETLAVVAYKQPVGRAEIERIRGVNAGEMLRSLLEKRLIRIAGRSEQLGNALLYGTTSEFLEHFGLVSIADLPRSAELSRKPAPKPEAAPEAPQTPAETAASIGLAAPAQTDPSDPSDPSDQSDQSRPSDQPEPAQS